MSSAPNRPRLRPTNGRAREKLTKFRRFITGTVAPHAAAHPNDKWVRHIVAQLNSIESTLGLIASA
ncbi:hypothetical protein BKD26_26430 [Streptomyces sp. CB03238]|nr:hypothetical protein BKD26_26430 [Streptomyces sp. CB03238]